MRLKRLSTATPLVMVIQPPQDGAGVGVAGEHVGRLGGSEIQVIEARALDISNTGTKMPRWEAAALEKFDADLRPLFQWFIVIYG